MSDVRELLRRGVDDYVPPEDALDRTRAKMKRRQRGRKVATIGLALAIAAAGIGAVLVAFGRSGAPAVSPPPSEQRALVMQMRPVEGIVPPGTARYRTLATTCGGSSSCTAGQLLRQRQVVLLDATGDKYRLGPVVISGSDVVSASAVDVADVGPRGWNVNFRLSPGGTTAFADATVAAARNDPPRNQIGIVVDGRVISAPAVQSRITGGTGRDHRTDAGTGRGSRREARKLVATAAGRRPTERRAGMATRPPPFAIYANGARDGTIVPSWQPSIRTPTSASVPRARRSRTAERGAPHRRVRHLRRHHAADAGLVPGRRRLLRPAQRQVRATSS